MFPYEHRVIYGLHNCDQFMNEVMINTNYENSAENSQSLIKFLILVSN